MANTDKHILVVEDDPEVAALLERGLREEGYVVRRVQDGVAGMAALESALTDLLILDINLPGVDGLEICRRVRAQPGYLPIIIVSGKSAESQRILGLELGADDYLAKPFSVLELVARVRALFRRVEALAQAPQGAALRGGRFVLDPVAREAKLDGAVLSLTAREFDLLHFFMRHPGRVFSRLELLDQVWGYGHDGYEHTVNSHINRLRGKVEADPAHPAHILTVWGVGYKFAPDGGSAA
ncbi:DNA-binding response regulator, OmpR family, contains REC and winged-helix (wHTH) domain [Methylomagnum ishizawai]|uniref:Phosphate regulon transcriptional regulatory protein PhoB n=1 Tax=Methylomagnum ishizawai TaxID=1760988 RepID=A0A1Y6CYH5_9GAMM|nr:response regulator transcription factor [Methylomagnum ishizawai]SMF93372.1 DNA-binding response regulator, OmpR family, contains REC and winged-helix (wHTH) domain [Methylomagnum ishizawai]